MRYRVREKEEAIVFTMAATIAGVSISTPKIMARVSSESPRSIRTSCLNRPWKRSTEMVSRRMYAVRPVCAAPDKLSDKVADSVKQAEEACADNPTSGECVAAWDEVEELSAAASDARDKKKGTDALEEYCKDNPETEECRTYDN